MITSDNIRKVFTVSFVLLFFVYLFGPLIIMSLTAFNSSAFPRVTPWECFSTEWFEVLVNDTKLIEGLRNSIFIALGVVCLSVPIGLAGALLLTQVNERIRPWYYTIVISPILVPGVVLGISTLLFWDRVGHMFGASRDTLFYNGFFLTIIGQATFISAYTMLVFISRLQRFDTVQEEAALDLGATHIQTFRRILLPFLKPAIGSAAVLAFLASFENYNTTVFTIITESTLTTFLAAKVRHGINPSISALAVAIVVISLLGAVLHEYLKRKELQREKEDEKIASGEITEHSKRRHFLMEPMVWMILAIFFSGIGTTYMAGTMGVNECKVEVREARRVIIQERIRAQQQKALLMNADKEVQQAAPAPSNNAKSNTPFNSIFDTGNLQNQVGVEEAPAPEKKSNSSYNNIFAPQNLEK